MRVKMGTFEEEITNCNEYISLRENSGVFLNVFLKNTNHDVEMVSKRIETELDGTVEVTDDNGNIRIYTGYELYGVNREISAECISFRIEMVKKEAHDGE